MPYLTATDTINLDTAVSDNSLIFYVCPCKRVVRLCDVFWIIRWKLC